MHHIEPYFGWRHLYAAEEDENSPFFEREYNEFGFSNSVYNYYIHPQWDSIGSETLYIKILFCDYAAGLVIIEFIGEWNDALYNDIMHLKRNVVDELLHLGITKFVLVGENVQNFHGDGNDYYEEWFEETTWIVALGFYEHVLEEWNREGISQFILYGNWLSNWRTLTPQKIHRELEEKMRKMLL